MMMALGMFVFSLPTAVYDDLRRRTDWRHEQTSRVGARPANQFLGPGDDAISLSGSIVPEISGQSDALDTLRQMGDQGDAHALVDGQGRVLGAFVIVSLDEQRRHFIDNGAPRWTDFGLELRRVDDPAAAGMPAPIAAPASAAADGSSADLAGLLPEV